MRTSTLTAAFFPACKHHRPASISLSATVSQQQPCKRWYHTNPVSPKSKRLSKVTLAEEFLWLIARSPTFLMVIREVVGGQESNQWLLTVPGVSGTTEPLIWFVGHLDQTGQSRWTNSWRERGDERQKTKDKREKKGFSKHKIENRGKLKKCGKLEKNWTF